MSEHNSQWEAESSPSEPRLIAAADALLLAANLPGRQVVHLGLGAAQAARLGFTTRELEEAAHFLQRLGLVVLVERGRAPAQE